MLKDKQHFTCLLLQSAVQKRLYAEEATGAAGHKARLCTRCVQADCQILFVENPNNSHVTGNSPLSGHTNKLPLLQKSKYEHIITARHSRLRNFFLPLSIKKHIIPGSRNKSILFLRHIGIELWALPSVCIRRLYYP